MAGAGHSHDTEYPDDTWNLYQHIESVEALNAETPEEAGGVFKPFVRRLDAEPCIVSDSDEELLIKVTFASPVHIRKIMVIGGGEVENHPSAMRVFVNGVAEGLDFGSAADLVSVQDFDLAPNLEGEGFVNTRQGPFTNVTSIAFYITGNHGGGDTTSVRYVGMQGDHTHDKRKAVHATYELLGTPHDTDVMDERGAAEGV